MDRLAGKNGLNLSLMPGGPPIVVGQLLLFVIDARTHRGIRPPAVRGPITNEAVTFSNALPITGPAHQLTHVLGLRRRQQRCLGEWIPVASG